MRTNSRQTSDDTTIHDDVLKTLSITWPPLVQYYPPLLFHQMSHVSHGLSGDGKAYSSGDLDPQDCDPDIRMIGETGSNTVP